MSPERFVKSESERTQNSFGLTAILHSLKASNYAALLPRFIPTVLKTVRPGGCCRDSAFETTQACAAPTTGI